MAPTPDELLLANVKASFFINGNKGKAFKIGKTNQDLDSRLASYQDEYSTIEEVFFITYSEKVSRVEAF